MQEVGCKTIIVLDCFGLFSAIGTLYINTYITFITEGGIREMCNKAK